MATSLTSWKAPNPSSCTSSWPPPSIAPWPKSRQSRTTRARVVLDCLDFGQGAIEGGGHELVHELGFGAFHEVRLVAISGEQVGQLLVSEPAEHRRIRDLVPVQVQERQHGPVATRIEKLVGMPARGQR